MKAIGDLQSGTGLWQSPNTGATNISGFTGLPGGYRNSNGGYSAIGYRGDWWSSSEYNANSAWYRSLDFNGANVGRNLTNKLNGFSVRCLRD